MSVDAVSQTQVAQTRVFIGSASLRPAKFAVGFGNGTVVDTCVAHGHKPVFVEFPVFIAIRAEPVASIVVPFIGEPDGDAVAVMRPQLLNESVLEFAYPFAFEKRDDLLAALRKLTAIAPPAVGRICERYAHRVATVPGVFGQADFLDRRLACKRGQRRPRSFGCGIHGSAFMMRICREGQNPPRRSIAARRVKDAGQAASLALTLGKSMSVCATLLT